MSSSNSSSRSHGRRETVGVPNRCWCGAKLTTFGSKTKENLFRRFYRCEIRVKVLSDFAFALSSGKSFNWIAESPDSNIVVDRFEYDLRMSFVVFTEARRRALVQMGKRGYYCEINFVDVNQHQQQAEFASFMKATTEAIATFGKCLDDAIFDMKCRLQEQTTFIIEGLASSTKENATPTIHDGLVSSTHAAEVAKTQTPLLKFAAAGIVFGTMVFLYAKLSN